MSGHNASFLEFEQSFADLENRIEDLRHLSDEGGDLNIVEEISKLQGKADRTLEQIYRKLTPWQKVLVARHPDRPHFLDYMASMVEDFTPLAGDRLYGDDQAILGGMGRLKGRSCVFIGHEKGHSTESRIKHNFGMASPEGYRKAVRLMELAEQFSLPVVSLIDTAGAHPGKGAEERGQAQAIAQAIETCLSVRTPIVSVVIGEGGSGGAIAIATADRVFMLEHAVYSVISPEGCASILWRSTDKTQQAAEALKLTAQDAQTLKVIDGIIKEPMGGAHREPEKAIRAVGDKISETVDQLMDADLLGIRQKRREKFLAMGPIN